MAYEKNYFAYIARLYSKNNYIIINIANYQSFLRRFSIANIDGLLIAVRITSSGGLIISFA